jgi:uncharacterized protein (TIGR03435 family)
MTLIRDAYQVQLDEISGPVSLRTERYEVTARYRPGAILE